MAGIWSLTRAENGLNLPVITQGVLGEGPGGGFGAGI